MIQTMQDDGESEMRRLKLELQRTMEMYSTACKEALTAKQKVARDVTQNLHCDSCMAGSFEVLYMFIQCRQWSFINGASKKRKG